MIAGYSVTGLCSILMMRGERLFGSESIINRMMATNFSNYQASSHTEDVERWLWENYAVFVLFLPARSPEWIYLS
jgi:hypothetical protein